MSSTFLSRTYRPCGGICFCFSHGLHIWRGMEMLVTFFPARSAAYIFGRGKILRACLPSVELPVAHWSCRNVVGISLSHESPMWWDMLLFLARIAYMAWYGNACNFLSNTLSCLYFWVWKSLACVPAVRRIAYSALELSKCCRHFSLARIAHVAGYAFVSRTDCI